MANEIKLFFPLFLYSSSILVESSVDFAVLTIFTLFENLLICLILFFKSAFFGVFLKSCQETNNFVFVDLRYLNSSLFFFSVLNSTSNKNGLYSAINFIIEIQEKLTETHKALKNITKIKEQIKQLKSSITDKEKNKEIIELADKIVKDLTKYENELYQTKSKSNQDPLNFPIKLNNKLAHLNSLSSIGDYKPTDQSIEFKNEVIKLIDDELEKVYSIFENEVKQLNKKVKQSDIELINLD